MTGKAKSGMFIGMLSTYASQRSVWVVNACTRIDPTGLHQAQHEPQRIRGVSVRCRGTENIFIRYGTQGIVSAHICGLSSSPAEDSGDKESTSYIEKPRARRRVCDVFITYMHVPGTYVYRIRLKVN